MRQVPENPSLKPMTGRRRPPQRRRPNPSVQGMNIHNAQNVNFLMQPTLIKLRNLTNLPEPHLSSIDQQIEFLLQRILELEAKVESLQKKIKYKKKKRIRRPNEQISKKLQCDACKKRYDTDASLKLHCKLKHSEYKEKDQEIPQKDKNQKSRLSINVRKEHF